MFDAFDAYHQHGESLPYAWRVRYFHDTLLEYVRVAGIWFTRDAAERIAHDVRNAYHCSVLIDGVYAPQGAD